MPDEPFDLHRAFYGKQRMLRCLLETGRTVATHPTAKGDGSELYWTEMLSAILPRRYKASKGFVVDSASFRSEQIDIIIHDHFFSPLLWEDGGYMYVPAESVYAVFEVKQELNREHIKYAGQKAASIRRRFRTEANFGWIQGITKKKDLFVPLAGLLTVDSEWKPAFGDPFYRALGSLSEEEYLDLGCTLNQGSWDLENHADPKSAQLSVPDAALISFCMHFLTRLQKLGSVGGIDYSEYERSAGLTRIAE
ncbi:MAG TPA: DUF6602 domain-containing protein [Ktedonobacteraceae bacterium]|nr:DUF6602 domain-containing protein [Ktedonobacteraceae bacterium]